MQKCNFFRLFLNKERIFDSWIIRASETANYFELLQTFHVHQSGYYSLYIEWLSKCRKTRSIRLEWKKLEDATYSTIPSSSLFAPINNVFEYSEIMTTCRLNKFFYNPVVIDADASVWFSTSNWLPQGLSLDPQEGLISGYPTSPKTAEIGNVTLSVKCGMEVLDFVTEIGISVFGSILRTLD